MCFNVLVFSIRNGYICVVFIVFKTFCILLDFYDEFGGRRFC